MFEMVKEVISTAVEDLKGYAGEAAEYWKDGLMKFRKDWKTHNQYIWMLNKAYKIATKIKRDTGYVFDEERMEEWIYEIINRNYSIVVNNWNTVTKEMFRRKIEEKMAEEAGIIMTLINVETGKTIQYVKEL